MKDRLAASALALGLILSACSSEYTDAQLVGTYVVEFGGDTATLTLNADHTYTHVVRRKNGQTIEDTSRWERHLWRQGGWARNVKDSDGAPRDPSARWTETRVDFIDFSVTPAYLDANPPGWVKGKGWSTPVELTWLGKVRLCFDDDVGYCYVKQRQ